MVAHWTLVQVNAQPHVARVCRHFLNDEGIDDIDWSPCSPDLNPNEHLWYIMYISHQVWQNYSNVPPTKCLFSAKCTKTSRHG